MKRTPLQRASDVLEVAVEDVTYHGSVIDWDMQVAHLAALVSIAKSLDKIAEQLEAINPTPDR